MAQPSTINRISCAIRAEFRCLCVESKEAKSKKRNELIRAAEKNYIPFQQAAFEQNPTRAHPRPRELKAPGHPLVVPDCRMEFCGSGQTGNQPRPILKR